MGDVDLQAYACVIFRKEDFKMVYVLNKNGEPLMPTNRYGKVRRLLKSKLAKVIQVNPFFQIQLLYDSKEFV